MSNNWVRVPVVTLLALAVMASPALASKETAGRVYFVGGDEQETGVRDYDSLLLDVMFRLGPRKKK